MVVRLCYGYRMAGMAGFGKEVWSRRGSCREQASCDCDVEYK